LQDRLKPIDIHRWAFLSVTEEIF